MSLVDIILNIAGLLMWVSWCGIRGLDAAGVPGTILSNLRPAGQRRDPRWGYLAALGALLLVRAVIYRQMGPAFHWTPVWTSPAASLSFRSDSFPRMLAYSFLGFGWWLLVGYTWACGIVALNRPPRDRDGVTRVVRRQLGWLGNLPPVLLLLVPALVAGVAWLGVGWLGARYRMAVPLQGGLHLVQQALVVAVSHLCVLRWLLAGVLLLHFVNLYVYLGNHAFWDFVQQTGDWLSRPLGFLRIGHIDLSPVGAALILWGVLTVLGAGLPWLKPALPGMPDWMEFGVWPVLFRGLPLG